MEERYNPHTIEEKWQKIWEETGCFRTEEDPSKKKMYILEMFPYPSGRIHMGHVRNYSIGDVIARYMRMKGYNVLHPMGWDAFGLPAENAAIEHGVHPAKWTLENIEYMKKQLRRLGFSYDWRREISTCDVSYYKWEQWLFLKMFERGLAYKKFSSVNWCEKCQTVLANEQVEGGCCWRCGTKVIQKELEQWFFKITKYADELLEYCDKLTGWPERVLVMQKNWIGKSQGVEIEFPLEKGGSLRIFTTRADTVFGITFMCIAPEHPMVQELIKDSPYKTEIIEFVEKVKKSAVSREVVLEKEGVFTGAYCINPFNGERIPIFVANFVIMEYGTGAIMSVPAHDQRDFEFAKKYNLPIRVVIQPREFVLDAESMNMAYEGEGIMVNSGHFSGLSSEEGRMKVVEYVESMGWGKRAYLYKLRDWGISRQRYWGCPIPIIYCERCGMVPVPESDLPVVLPFDVEITGEKGSPLSHHKKFVNVKCPRCGIDAKRETDTMDTFVDSSWYFERFCCPDYEGFLDSEKVKYWMPVDLYIGGIEHAVLHLLYARFFTKVLRDFGIVEIDEPFTNLLTQGMVIKDGAKMSKSKGNVVDPDDMVKKYGADTVRLFLLFAAPPEKDLDWSDKGIEGCYRFLNRVWRITKDVMPLIKDISPCRGKVKLEGSNLELRRITHRTLKKVTEDIEERYHFNTAISAIMEFVNYLSQWKPESDDTVSRSVLREAIETLVIILSPFAPHICEEIWSELGGKRSLIYETWPEYDPEVIEEKNVLVVIQINGRVRDRVVVVSGITESELLKMVMGREKIKMHLQGKNVKKTIYIPDKILNIVTD